MKKQVLCFGILILALAALPMAGAVAGGKARPFKAASVGYILVDYGNTYDFVMNGQATHLGEFELQLLGILWLNPVNPGDPANVSSGSVIAANGDSVNLHMEDYFDHMDPSLGAVLYGTCVITEGTGRIGPPSGTRCG